jgi:molybdopterin converting factor small subunit
MQERATFTLLLFAGVREALSRGSIDLELPLPVRAADLLTAFFEQFPQLQGMRTSCRLAVDQSFAAESQTLLPHQELALIPPVSGG